MKLVKKFMQKYKYQYVITRTPYRISLGGGGTDLPFYSKIKSADLISAAINQYCIVSVGIRKVDKDILIQTTKVERVKEASEIKHDIIRACLEYFKINDSVQISTFSTIPSKTGLGSSSTLTVGLVHALAVLKGIRMSKKQIARTSWFIERKILSLEGGIQDQYIASYGGIRRIQVSKGGKVLVTQVKLKKSIMMILEKYLIMIFSGQQRNSVKVVKGVVNNIHKSIKLYDIIKSIGAKTKKFLLQGDIENIGILMDQHWLIKKKLSNSISNDMIDKKYIKLKKIGSNGGKIIGAGGGGFYIMAVSKKNIKKFKNELKKHNFYSFDWKFDMNGSCIIEKKIN